MFSPKPVLRSPHLLGSLHLPMCADYLAAVGRGAWSGSRHPSSHFLSFCRRESDSNQDMNRQKWDTGGGDATAA